MPSLKISPDVQAETLPEDRLLDFGIVRFRTEKFVNHDEDSSKVDRCSDCPDVMEVFRKFHEAK